MSDLTAADSPVSVPARTPVATVQDVVEVKLPATGAYLSVLRTATAGLAARMEFTLDEIEDLRIAVDEACAMLLPAATDSELTCRFELTDSEIDVAVSVHSSTGRLPSRDTFSWTVLSALAGSVDASVDADSRVTITLHKRRDALGGS